MKTTVAAGGVIVRDSFAGIEVALVRERCYSDWILPKGHLEVGETLVAAALREVREEAGFTRLKIIRMLGKYTVSHTDELKTVYYFLMRLFGDEDPYQLLDRDRFEVRWFLLDCLPQLYDSNQQLLLVIAREKMQHHTLLQP